MIQFLNPKNIFTALDKIDNEHPSYTLTKPQTMRRVFWTLACVAVCLLIIHYMKYSSTMVATLKMLSSWSGEQNNYFYIQLQKTGFRSLFSYVWWTFWHIIGYVVIPFFIIKYVLKEKFIDMGWRWGTTHEHWKGYVLLITPIFFFIFLVSFRQDFLNHYPFYKLSHRSWFDLIAWEVLYLTQFICLEFFFRGFFINALRPAIGANAVWVMCVPYLMIHFPKLWPEATGAILFGLFLGILALQSRSIWGGFFVHAGIAVGMDITSLLKQGKIPTQFWPF